MSLKWLLHLHAACALVVQSHAVQLIAGSASSFATIHSSQHLLVAIHEEGSKFKPEDLPQGTINRPMTDKDGRQFTCYIPPNPQAKIQDPQHKSENPVATGKEGAASEQKTPFELLERLSTLCLYRQEGLWTYEMCYKKHARQFRQPNGNDKGEDFSCGKYTGDDRQSMEIKIDPASPSEASHKYVSHIMSGGAACALSGYNRTTEVRYICSKDVRENVVTSVREFPTCKYIFTVATPLLCKHPEFKPPDEVVRTLHCVPSSPSPKVDEDGQSKERTRQVYEQGNKDASVKDTRGSISLDDAEDVSRFTATQQDSWPGNDYQVFIDAESNYAADGEDDDPYLDEDDDEIEKANKKDHTEL